MPSSSNGEASSSENEFEPVPTYATICEMLNDAKEEVANYGRQLESQKENFRQMVNNYDGQLTSKKEALQEEKERTKQLEAELNKLSAERAVEQSQLKESSTSEVELLEAKLEESKQLHSQQMQAIQAKLQTSQTDCQHAEDQAKLLLNVTREKDEEISNLKTQLAVLQGQAEDWREDNLQERGQFDELFGKLEEAESCREALEYQNASLQQDLEELQSSIERRDDKLQELMTEIEVLKGHCEQLQQENENSRMLADDLSAATARNMVLEEQSNNTNESYARVERDKAELEEKIAQLQEETQRAEQRAQNPQANAANAHPGPTPAAGPPPAAGGN